ncbi:hypothetical protein D3C73_1416830 [compost metagenome]
MLSSDLNGDQIIPVPLDVDEPIEVGWIANHQVQLSQQAARYVEELKAVIQEYGL